MTFEQLLYVQTLAQHHSQQAAADALHISKSGLSTAITQLEEELGIHIFIRDAKGTRLSSQGNQLLSDINNILEAKNTLENTAYDLSHTDHQTIRIHYQNTLFKPMVDILLRHPDAYENISFDFSCHELASIINDVRTQTIDAGFIAINNQLLPSLADLHFQPIIETRLVILCDQDHDLYKKPVTIEALQHQKFCLFNDASHDAIFSQLQSRCGPLQLVLRTDDSWAMNEAITKLHCISFGRLAQSRFSSDNRLMHHLVTIPINHLIDDHFMIGWLLNPVHYLSPLKQSYLSKVTAEIQKEAD